MKFLNLFLTSICSLLTALPAKAQPEPAVGEIDTAPVITFGSWERPLKGLYYKSGEDFLPIDAPNYSRGKPLPLIGESIGIYRKNPEQNYQEVARWPRLKGSEKLWVLLVQAQKGTVHGIVCPDDAVHFPRRHVRVLNVTPYPMVAKIDDTVIQVAPLSHIIRPTETDLKSRFNYALASEVPGEDWEIISNARTRLPSTHRCTLIAAMTQGFGIAREGVHLEVLAIKEYLSLPTPPTK